MRNGTYVCVPCRRTARTLGRPVCPCGTPMAAAPYGWRPPRRGDDRAWADIAQGRWLTEPVTFTSEHRRFARAGAPRVPYAVRTRRPDPVPRPRAPGPFGDLHAALLGCAEGDPDALKRVLAYARSANDDIRRELASRSTCPPQALAVLTGDADPNVRATALAHSDAVVTAPMLTAAARSSSARVRAVAAGHARTPRDTLRALLLDPDTCVARAAAANPGTRVRDLLDVPVGHVPAERLRAVIAAVGRRPVRGAGTAPALAVLDHLRGAATLTVREALDTATAVLG